MQFDPELSDTLKKYFSFSRREYKATLALFSITFILWIYSDVKQKFFPQTFDTTALMLQAQELDKLQNKNHTEEFSKTFKDSINQDKAAPVYFSFNPNTASDDDFEKLGLSKKQIHMLRNFLAKVGEIKSKSAFSKIYGISETQFEALAPYIDLPENNPGRETFTSGKKEKQKLSVEINSADSLAFDRLPGIGMGYARRIIKYRTALGGFIDISQLMEVYGFRQGLLDTIKPFLTLDLSLVQKININTASLDDLKKHPYIRYKLANAILNYKQQHGNFTSIDDLKNIVAITDDIYQKIKSYVIVD